MFSFQFSHGPRGAAHKTSAILCGALLSVFAGLILAAEPDVAVKKYPPYPDVWGVEFPDPGPHRGAIFGVVLASNGDILLQETKNVCDIGKKSTSADDNTQVYCYYTFFDQHEHLINLDEFNNFAKRFGSPNSQKLLAAKKMEFPDGAVLSVHGETSSGCGDPFPGYYELKDPSGKTLLRKSIFVRLDKPESLGCRVEPDLYTISVDTTARPLVPLEDGTFLLANVARHYVLRFNKQFETRFPYDRSRIFIVDTDAVDAARQRAKARCEIDYSRCMDEEMRKVLGI